MYAFHLYDNDNDNDNEKCFIKDKCICRVIQLSKYYNRIYACKSTFTNATKLIILEYFNLFFFFLKMLV